MSSYYKHKWYTTSNNDKEKRKLRKFREIQTPFVKHFLKKKNCMSYVLHKFVHY